MTWTYSSTGTSTLDRLRRRIGDTDTNSQLLTDEEIEDFLDEHSDDLYLAGAACCDAICAKLGRDVDRSGLGMQTTRSQKFQHYKDLAVALRNRASSGAAPFLGGTSESRRDEIEADTDFVPPAFERDRDENP